MFGDTQQREKKCGFCNEEVSKADEMIVERKPVHKNCFKCGVCGKECKVGQSLAQQIPEFGCFFFCFDHRLLSPGEKVEGIKAKGYQKKAASKK
uniref:LIM zinc-binding domain-containing protein n=1 Tax=Panagrolaimus davidi TaxID=227884 RepID=A0A914Q7M9_9BILA